MKKSTLMRLTAIVLVFTLVFSFSGFAFATEVALIDPIESAVSQTAAAGCDTWGKMDWPSLQSAMQVYQDPIKQDLVARPDGIHNNITPAFRYQRYYIQMSGWRIYFGVRLPDGM